MTHLAGLLNNENEGNIDDARLTTEMRIEKKKFIKLLKIMPAKQIYNLINNENGSFDNLGLLIEDYHKKNSLKLITYCFVEKLEDNLLRIFAIGIINSLEILDRNYSVHFDLNLEKFLINQNLEIKFSELKFLTKVKKQNKLSIPEGTTGYLTPEFYLKELISEEVARKQDYFALGCILYFIKFGNEMFNYQKYEQSDLNYEKNIEICKRKIITNLKSQKLLDQELSEFITSLIQIEPENRPNFEQIYRNKWLNRNKLILNDILDANDNDRDKLFMELQKSDFLIKKKKDSTKKDKRFKFKKKLKK